MKDLIKKALDEAYDKLNKQRPKTKKAIKSIDISDVKPLDLPNFMKENDVPSEAHFDGTDNGYDAWYAGEVKLSWTIDVSTTKEDDMKFNKKRFTNIAWNCVRPLLLENGYQRVGYNSGLLIEFRETTVYEMYMNKEFDRLVKYYSFPFVPLDK